MHLDLHYVNPRLVSLYDSDNPRGGDTDFYLSLADKLGVRKIVDLACGTKLMARQLAIADRDKIGQLAKKWLG